jgi:hypothetical protein
MENIENNKNKQNLFIKKLKEESKTEFEKAISIIQHDSKLKTIFYYFLYNDILNIDDNNKNNNVNISNMVYEPSIYVNNKLDRILLKINNNNNGNNIYVQEFKKELIASPIRSFRSDRECFEFIVNLLVTPFVVTEITVFEFCSKFTDTVNINSVGSSFVASFFTFNLVENVLEAIFVELWLICKTKLFCEI